MKTKPFLALALLLLLTNCTTIRWSQGMSEKEFTAQSKQIKMIEMSPQRTVYKVDFWNNGVTTIRFFYFHNGKLVQMDEGVRPADIVIQNN